ncbi:hypothetical protein AGDE_03530 [Angomonas deanei]|nr:hypothetical protein AGDE_03530 [Angomonas deanei]|eukprot:EPY40398.1 hypothetical protein AGDE_03530 [Angomonas deanei]
MYKGEEVEGKKTRKYLVGSENVLVFLREKMLPLVYDALPAVHATHWVAQYTINFLRSLATQTEREAQLRVELLARCVKLLGRTESFSAILLSIQSKSEEYDAFTLLRDSAQEHLSFLLDTIDEGLRAVLSCRFPHRRQRLALIERGIKAKLQRSLLFMNELDYNWAPNVKFHAEWKEAFLSRIFHRIHEDIAARFVYCTMGFIDQALYEKVKNFNTGKTQGTEVIRARLVEHEKTVEKLTFQQIGMTIKGSASIVVGLQLCLGARFILNQCTAAFDEVWGFPMHEDAEGPSDETVSKAVNVISKQAKQKANPTQTNSTRVKSTFFLTQEEEDE